MVANSSYMLDTALPVFITFLSDSYVFFVVASRRVFIRVFKLFVSVPFRISGLGSLLYRDCIHTTSCVRANPQITDDLVITALERSQRKAQSQCFPLYKVLLEYC